MRPGEAAGEPGMPLIRRGEGCWLEDDRGKRYLDAVGALEAMVAGHGRHRLAEVAERQMRDLAFLDLFRYTSEPAVRLAAKLAEIAPGPLERVHFTPGGSEAVETAMKIALQHWHLAGTPRRRRFVSRAGSYHGVTFGAMALGGSYFASRNDIYRPDPELGKTAAAPAAEASGFGKGGRHVSCAHRIAERVEQLRPETVAAVVVDPLGTASGVATAPLTDLVALRRLCDEHGILLVVDEVITGFGHTGALLVCEQAGVVPDILTISKGLSSGYVPIGATVVHSDVAERFEGRDGVFAHGQTYGGHPVACAVALENIAILEEERLPERAGELGPYFLEGLRSLESHRTFWDARASGLLGGVEVVADGRTGVDFASPADAGRMLRLALRDAGLVAIAVHPGNVLLLAPPLTITRREIDRLVEMLDEGLSRLERADLPPTRAREEDRLP